MRDNKVSIILPTRREPEYLSQSIKSCLGQTHKNIELIVIDDFSIGSRIKDTVKSFSDKRIKFYRNNSIKGISHCLNTGFKKSEGEFITWTSDDNYFDDGAIEKMLTHLYNNNEKCVYTSFYCFKNNDIANKSIVRLFDKGIMARNCFACLLFERGIIDSTGLFNTNIYFTQYYDYLLRVSKKFNISFLNEPLYYLRLHPGSLSPTDNKNFKCVIENILVEYKNSVIDKSKALESLVDAGIKYIAENVKGLFLLDFSLKNPSLYKLYIMQRLDEVFLEKRSAAKSFSGFKKDMETLFDKIETKLAEFKTGGISARRKIVIGLMNFLLNEGLDEIYDELKYIIRSNFDLDFGLLTNITYLEFNHKFNKSDNNEDKILKVDLPHNNNFLDTGVKNGFYSILSKFRENKPNEYYFYRLMDEFNNSCIYRKPEEIISSIESFKNFLNNFTTEKFILEKALSLASNNDEITEVQKKIQELYKASLNN